MATRAIPLLLAVSAARGLPGPVPLRLDEGFWLGSFAVGPQHFTLTIDTGSFATIIQQGLYLPTNTSQQTDLGEFIQFNGAGKDGTLPASETISFVRDDAGFAGLSVRDFLVGNITNGDALPGDGVAGFSPNASDFDPGDPTFSSGQSLFQTLCDQGDVTPCQFGLALETSGQGSFILGDLDKLKIKGEVTTLPTTPNDSWTVVNSTEADSPILVINGQPFTHIVPTFDSGGPNVVGPLTQVRAALLSVGYNVTEQENGGVTFALGTYDCSKEPARFGFSFPPSNAVHYIDITANELNRTTDGRVCTANILGTSTLDGSLSSWSIGQTWFQGRYVQHDLEGNTLSFADLALS